MVLNELAAWIAPIATMIAAMMTAANLGARTTGWGFVVFVIGSVCWVAVGIASGQTNLIASNGFLTAINLVGIWRWLGRQRAYEDGAKSAKAASHRSTAPTLFAASGIGGMPVVSLDGATLGKAVEALLECRSGTVSYVVVASGGIGGIEERLRPVPRQAVRFGSDRLVLDMPQTAFEALEPLGSGDWPAAAPTAQVAAA